MKSPATHYASLTRRQAWFPALHERVAQEVDSHGSYARRGDNFSSQTAPHLPCLPKDNSFSRRYQSMLKTKQVPASLQHRPQEFVLGRLPVHYAQNPYVHKT